jgi:HAE1 family hydrophobic/amphiphilic exporter-1
VVAAAFSPSAALGGPRVLTLGEAVDLAREHNKDIRKALENRNLYQGRYLEERAAAFPRLTALGTASRWSDRSQEPMHLPASGDTLDAGVVLEQALFTWGRIPAAIRAATLGLDLWRDDLEVARQEVVRDVTVAFHDIQLARELLAVARENLAQKERSLGEVRSRLGAGTATDFDLLSAEVSLANAGPEVIRGENRLRLARERLRFLIGLEGEEVDAAGSLDQVAPEELPAFQESLTRALASRPELSSLRRVIGMKEEVARIQAAGDKPSLGLQASGGWKDADTGGREGEGLRWSANLLLTVPVFDGFRTRGKTAQARSEVASLRLDEARLREGIALEVRSALHLLQEARETILALSGTVDQARRLLEMAEKGFQYGVKTKLEVDDAALNLTAARASLARARRDYAAASVSLAWVTGSL